MSNLQTISLTEALKKSDYSDKTKEKIKLFIFESITKLKGKTLIIQTFCFGKNIFAIKHILEVELKNAKYPIHILMYLTVDFPDNFRIYIHKVTDFGINPVCIKKQIIDQATLELNYQSFINYKPLEKPITNLIETILIEFSNTFPLYKSNNNEEYYGPCILNEEKSFLINISEEDLKKYESLNELRTQLTSKILDSINNISFEIQKSSSELDMAEAKINEQIKACSHIRSNENIKLEDTILSLQTLEGKLKSDINKLKKNTSKSILDECNEVIKIKDEEKFKYTVMQKTIEDYLKYIRKSMEKNLISLDEGIEQTRRLSKELFFIKYIIDKKNNVDN